MTQEEALSILKTGANVFLTGEPGSGKTYVINRYVRFLRERGIMVAVTASTGIAATHIGGFTIHSWCGIGVRRALTKRDLDGIASNKRIARRVRAARILVIDEISMLSAQTFALADAACRAIRASREAFGGLQIVVVGDFFQLPPVVTKDEKTHEGQQALTLQHASEALFAFDSPVWGVINPIVCYLSEQHRQEDAAFLEILGALRSGTISVSHRALLEARRHGVVAPGATKLFSHNADVDRVNVHELGKLAGKERAFAMVANGPKDLVLTIKRGCLSPENLSLKIGARVMFTKNDMDHRFVNGTLGTVTDWSGENGYPIVKTWAGAHIVAEPEDWSIEDGAHTLARIRQIPLRLAWAITVHKSQGMSLDAAHIDLSNAFEHGQGYVALSRVRSLRGLSLAGFNERALEVHPEIAVKDTEFRNASQCARENLAHMPTTEVIRRQNDFIRACGGRVESAISINDVEARGAPSVATDTYAAIREKYPNAYRPWSDADDVELVRRHNAGEETRHIAAACGRKSGAIRSRLMKLGLI
ncbi:MAG: AAA family ATPase [bacterium]|nr:AAA family ATPase [bacterium]